MTSFRPIASLFYLIASSFYRLVSAGSHLRRQGTPQQRAETEPARPHIVQHTQLSLQVVLLIGDSRMAAQRTGLTGREHAA